MEERSTTDKKPAGWPPIDTVLVIDDDENWCFLSKRILQKAGLGKQIITATNGLEAMQLLQTLSVKGDKLPELILLDIKMPVMDGFEFLEEITKSGILDLSHTRIMMCTSSILPKDKERANLYPVAAFITKPLTIENLRHILNA